MKRGPIVYLDGIVQVKRIKVGYRVELIAGSGHSPQESLHRAADAIGREWHGATMEQLRKALEENPAKLPDQVYAGPYAAQRELLS